MHGYIFGGRRTRKFHHTKRTRTATLRAFTGAKLRLGIPISAPSLNRAAILVSSTPGYISAAITIIKSEDSKLIERVKRGHIGILEAAAQVRNCAQVLSAMRKATPADLIAAAKTYGVDDLFENTIVPASVNDASDEDVARVIFEDQ
jgi:hypothetical protein